MWRMMFDIQFTPPGALAALGVFALNWDETQKVESGRQIRAQIHHYHSAALCH